MSPLPPTPEPVQASLLPPEVVELTLRVGIMGCVNHAQIQYEIRNATDNMLLAMWSRPHLEVAGLEPAAHAALQELLEQARTLVVPF